MFLKSLLSRKRTFLTILCRIFIVAGIFLLVNFLFPSFYDWFMFGFIILLFILSEPEAMVGIIIFGLGAICAVYLSRVVLEYIIDALPPEDKESSD